MKSMLLLALTLFAVSCTKNEKSNDQSRQLLHPFSSDHVILEYTGGTITAGQIEEKMKPHLEKAREALFQAYLREAELLLVERNQDRMQFNIEVTDLELKNYIQANKLQATPSEKVREFLMSEKMRMAKQNAVIELKNSLNVKSRLGAATFDLKELKDLPSRGGSQAEIIAQVFCDFANGMCSRLKLVLTQAENQFGEKFKWYFRHFPVASNAGSFDAAKVAICAHEQKKFWIAYEELTNLSGLVAGKDLSQILADKGLDLDELKKCLQSETTTTQLNNDIKSAESIGIQETPTIVINGEKVKDLDSVIPKIQSQISAKSSK